MRRFRTSVGSGIDADRTEKKKTIISMENYRINGVAWRRLLADTTAVTEANYGYGYGYRRTCGYRQLSFL